ncbi:hypothetical protein H0H87_010269 [Tephrocybe sp. NHM501043]|nr:hypothetical protein H0H87_010269 [Tephrocybe sp. NHM501043]
MPLLTIYNPACGDRSAKTFFDIHVVPLLQQNDKFIDSLVATEHAGHAGQLVIDFVKSTDNHGEITVVLGSGDGTLHEIINFVSSNAFVGFPKLQFVLIPCGTANALYASLFLHDPKEDPIAYKLQSLQSYINNSKRTIPLTLAIAKLSSPPNEKKLPQVTVSSVVTSTSLHAAILHDSEALREEMPGIERFKVAAMQNSTKWCHSYVKLLPAPVAGRVEIYDPATKAFIDHPESDEHDPIVDVDGPFAYFLSTVNVDRLEPDFRITPLARTIPPVEATCEVVMVRPMRDPTISQDTLEARELFAPKLFSILGGAYDNGAHVDIRHDVEKGLSSDGDAPLVVEYIRCGGWEWIPDELDEHAHLLCSDGAISHIEKRGRAVCNAVTPQNGTGFAVYV